MEGNRERPTAEEVIAKLKDDGDFDNLRLMIIRKVKENEELRNSIITEVKQSAILNEDGSENLKPKQLSDAIYLELGKKIMGQISDEVWKVIRSNDKVKDEIRGTVESVHDRIVNPKVDSVHRATPKENSISVKENNLLATETTTEANTRGENEPNEPPGFSSCGQLPGSKVEQNGVIHDKQTCLPPKEVAHPLPDRLQPDDDAPPGFVGTNGIGAAFMPPGFESSSDAASMPPGFDAGGVGDMPPGFDIAGCGSGPPGFGRGGVGEDDDPDVPPGFG